MSDYCKYPNQCGIGADCRECMSDEIERLQAKIDSVMAEHCPEEMTKEQVVEWGSNQRVVSAERMAEINKAVKEEGATCSILDSVCYTIFPINTTKQKPKEVVEAVAMLRHENASLRAENKRQRGEMKALIPEGEKLRDLLDDLIQENERLREALESAYNFIESDAPGFAMNRIEKALKGETE